MPSQTPPRKSRRGLIANAIFSARAGALARLFDPRRDLDKECGYPPSEPQLAEYRAMYDRELGRRVVGVYPEETWRKRPDIFEDEDPNKQTPFEASLADIERRHNLLHYMQRIDELSGIARFGVLLWGLNDGRALSEPVEGWEGWEDEKSTAKARRQLLFIRALDESYVTVASWEANPASPRYGLPVSYNVLLAEPDGATGASGAATSATVHWTRLTHVADNRMTSEVYGTPRMLCVWNRLLDLKKILGGSGEMFWKGGFPGISLETQPGSEGGTIDETATREMMDSYMNGLQRYLALSGMEAKSIAPQVADPTPCWGTHIKAICTTLHVPYRVFVGIEEGVVSGDQATRAWLARLANRQQRYVTPLLINPIIRRLVDYGVLEAPAKPLGWTVRWPDLAEQSAQERADTAARLTEALAKYVAGGVDALVPPLEYLTVVCGLPDAQAKQIIEAAVGHGGDLNGDETAPHEPA